MHVDIYIYIICIYRIHILEAHACGKPDEKPAVTKFQHTDTQIYEQVF